MGRGPGVPGNLRRWAEVTPPFNSDSFLAQTGLKGHDCGSTHPGVSMFGPEKGTRPSRRGRSSPDSSTDSRYAPQTERRSPKANLEVPLRDTTCPHLRHLFSFFIWSFRSRRPRNLTVRVPGGSLTRGWYTIGWGCLHRRKTI